MNQPSPAQRVPESMGPKELGSYMRGLREHFKLSQQDVSEQLHIRVRYVAAIEEGNYTSMPGKVYARGYVATYAEFLGLDPDQVVAQCFPEDPVEAAAAASAKPTLSLAARAAMPSRPSYGPNWRLVGIVGAVIVVILAAHSLLSRDATVEEQEETVAQVPEALLASVRSVVVPQAHNYDCLMGDSQLGCFFAQSSLAQMDAMHAEDVQRFEDEIAEVEANPPAVETQEAND